MPLPHPKSIFKNHFLMFAVQEEILITHLIFQQHVPSYSHHLKKSMLPNTEDDRSLVFAEVQTLWKPSTFPSIYHKPQSLTLLQECGIAFLFAPQYHPIMKQVAPLRKDLGIRTIFNMIGPLLNPFPITHPNDRCLFTRNHVINGFCAHQKGRQSLIIHAKNGLDENLS